LDCILTSWIKAGYSVIAVVGVVIATLPAFTGVLVNTIPSTIIAVVRKNAAFVSCIGKIHNWFR